MADAKISACGNYITFNDIAMGMPERSSTNWTITLPNSPTTKPKEKSVTEFKGYSPHDNDDINATKLTEKNLRTVAAHILKTIGGQVTVDDSGISLGDIAPSPVDGREIPLGPSFVVGEWIVEEYSYSQERMTFRTATLDERKRYDLR